MRAEFTAVYKTDGESITAFVEELHGTATQGETLEEARENLEEAVRLVLESSRAFARQNLIEGDVIRERLRVRY